MINLKRIKKQFKNTKKKQCECNLYSYWDTFWLSFYSPNAYVDAAKRWKGRGIFYLMFVSFLLSFPLFIEAIYKVNQYFEESIQPSVSAMPDLLIRKGVATIVESGTDKPATPQVWIWPPEPTEKYKTPFFVINTKRSIQSFGSAFIPILVVHNAFRIQIMPSWLPSNPATDAIAIPFNEDRVVGAEELGSIVQAIKKSIIYSGYNSLACLLWGITVIFAGFSSFIGQMAARTFLSYSIKWSESLRLLCVALTPGVSFLTMIQCLTSLNRYWVIGALVITLLYYLFGVRALRDDKAPRFFY